MKVADFAQAYREVPVHPGLHRVRCPRILAADDFRAVVACHSGSSASSDGRSSGAWAGMSLSAVMAPVLSDLMRRGLATAFAMNGSASIHDFEIALAGHTSEDVEAVLPDGSFGSAEKPGER